jgi:NAD(P)H-dependent flavin oxidoreductase YrpB (nitropropane dioxygenase family)
MFRTRITEMLAIEYPIIQGAMQWLARAELAAAVSNAGGLGIISSFTFPDAGELRKEIRKTRSLTDRPFAVNVTLLPTIRPINIEEYISVAIDEGVGIIETAGRNPRQYMKLLKDGGVTVLHKVASVRALKTAERIGVDAVTIVGFEEGGNPGLDDVPTSVLIPVAVDSVKIPVIAAGGIGDARGFVAALALGAEGVLMGTRFMLSRECPLHLRIKEWLLQATEKDTMMIMRSINNPERVATNDFTRSILQMEEKGASLEELMPMISGLRQQAALDKGDVDEVMLPCGQAVGLMHDIPSVREIIEGIVSEAMVIGRRLNDMGLLA